MKLGPVIKHDSKNIVVSQKFEDNAMPKIFDLTVLLAIFSKSEAGFQKHCM